MTTTPFTYPAPLGAQRTTTPPWGAPPPLVLIAAVYTRIDGVSRLRTVLTVAANATKEAAL